MSSTASSSEALETFSTATGSAFSSSRAKVRSRSLPRSRAVAAGTPNVVAPIPTASASVRRGRRAVSTESMPADAIRARGYTGLVWTSRAPSGGSVPGT